MRPNFSYFLLMLLIMKLIRRHKSTSQVYWSRHISQFGPVHISSSLGAFKVDLVLSKSTRQFFRYMQASVKTKQAKETLWILAVKIKEIIIEDNGCWCSRVEMEISFHKQEVCWTLTIFLLCWLTLCLGFSYFFIFCKR